MHDSNLMPLAATIVAVLYALGVVVRRSSHWYEWIAAAAGAGFAIWFWLTEYRRAKRSARRK